MIIIVLVQPDQLLQSQNHTRLITIPIHLSPGMRMDQILNRQPMQAIPIADELDDIPGKTVNINPATLRVVRLRLVEQIFQRLIVGFAHGNVGLGEIDDLNVARRDQVDEVRRHLLIVDVDVNTRLRAGLLPHVDFGLVVESLHRVRALEAAVAEVCFVAGARGDSRDCAPPPVHGHAVAGWGRPIAVLLGRAASGACTPGVRSFAALRAVGARHFGGEVPYGRHGGGFFCDFTLGRCGQALSDV